MIKDRSYQSFSKAFTLLELMLVVVILSVTAALSVPNFIKFAQNLEFKRSAEDLVSVIRYGQLRALTYGRSLRVMLNPSGYWLEEERPSEDQAAQVSDGLFFQRLKSRFGRRFSLSGEIRLRSSDAQIMLSPDGRIQPFKVQVCRADKCILVSTNDHIGKIVVIDENERTDNAS